eukprot:3708905-Amphidinium_carterae.1
MMAQNTRILREPQLVTVTAAETPSRNLYSMPVKSNRTIKTNEVRKTGVTKNTKSCIAHWSFGNNPPGILAKQQ